MRLISLIIVLFVAKAQAGTNCFSVKGTLKCEKDKYRAADVEVYLMDDDGAMNNDDRMGWTTSDEDGSFRVEGCGYDFTTEPDPYLRIMNMCNGDNVITTRIGLPQRYAPEVINVGMVVLDRK